MFTYCLLNYTQKKAATKFVTASFLMWTSLGLNQGPPDYEYLKVIFRDILLLCKYTDNQCFTKMRFSMNIKKHP